jgi:acetyl-CoA carboxylase carboxyltransferase component
MRSELTRYAPRDRPVANRLVLDVQAPWTLPLEEADSLARRFGPLAARVGLEKVVLKIRVPDTSATSGLRDAVLQFEDVGHSILVREDRAGDQPVRSLGSYQQKVLTAARFGSPYPYEIVRLFTQHEPAPGLPADSFVELDLDANDRLVPVQREPGGNSAHIVVGLLTNHSEVVPEGMQRVALLSDPTQGLGNLAEPECRRVNAALAYALEHRLPVEWFAVSSGALIAMDSGTENMDWIALTLRRLIEFTQAGGEINIVVTGINVGGQPYWNAEATMLTHTKGILVMTPSSAMVLTGKQALDFSGAVSAEDNFGIGGYHRVMGPNGQAQYWAPSFADACALLLRHYELTYVVPGERFPRRRPTGDPVDRDVRTSPHSTLADCPFRTVGDVFSAELNPERKQPFDMRSIMRAVADTDAEPLERWKDLSDGDTSIVWDTTVGGIPVSLLGIESHTLGRQGYVPADGPPAWTSGTLFPHASRKTARAVNAASGNRPLVVLANLSGFDGSPESMRRRQLEFGAEIGRAVTNFDGPIVFVVVSRYHGGAFVVFSKALNAGMEIAAVEGSYASVIGGAPAAATVFAREVKQRTEKDPRVRTAREAASTAGGTDAARLRTFLVKVTEQVRSEKLGEVADEFDGIHTIERALRVGSVDRIIAAADLRPYVVDALERGLARHT